MSLQQNLLNSKEQTKANTGEDGEKGSLHTARMQLRHAPLSI